MIVINNTGDRIHFGLAVEKANQEGLKVYFMKDLVNPKHVLDLVILFKIWDFNVLFVYLSGVG